MRLLWVLGLSSCVLDQERYLERQKAICHVEYGCVERPWWPDVDGDGWGDPSFEPTVADQAPTGMVNNLLDCDDIDPNITADVAGLCPAEFGEVLGVAGGLSEADLGEGPQPVEWVFVSLEPGLLLFEAEDRCELGWGGVLGAPRSAVGSESGPVWLAGSTSPVDASWTLEGDVPDGALVWDDGALVQAGPATTASVACTRPVPDPAEWETFGALE